MSKQPINNKTNPQISGKIQVQIIIENMQAMLLITEAIRRIQSLKMKIIQQMHPSNNVFNALLWRFFILN